MRKEILLLSLLLTVGCAADRQISVAPAAPPPPAVPAAAAVPDVCADLESPGAVPAIPVAGRPLRVLAFGDYGDGGRGQQSVAAAAVRYDRDHPFDLGITLGDNFYNTGINDPESPRWKEQWEDLYNPLGIRFYATLGNHDYYDPKSPGAEIARSKQSGSWCLPRRYYTFTAGPVQLFALDTDPIEKGDAGVAAQLDWLRDALQKSRAPWKVAYGHHPIYSTGDEHGDTPEMIRDVLPLLAQYGVDAYVAGHDHHMEYLKPEGALHFFVSGAGGHKLRGLGKDTGRRAWAVGMTPGFAVLDADADSLVVSFWDAGDKQLCKVTIAKGQPDVADCP